MTDTPPSDPTPQRWTWPRPGWIVFACFVGIMMLWLTPIIAQWVAGFDLENMAHLYAVLFTFVTLDAIVPIFPSESILNLASALAGQDGSTIVLWKIMLAGALGAIVGDSLLYWLSRTVLRQAMSNRVDQALANPKIDQAMQVMNRNAPILITFGRFVPGLRFMVGATMGLTRFPYRRFLLWDVIGGTLWAVYTCALAYLVSSVLNVDALVSAIVSGVVTTVFLALIYTRLKKSWQRTQAAEAPPNVPTPVPVD
jgi:membrane-associated protein